MISFFSEETDFTLKGKRLISKWLRQTAKDNGRRIGVLNYIFCSDPYLLQINRQFLGHDYYTDIITFDYSDDYEGQYPKGTISGDIYISIDTVRANGLEYGEGFEREIMRVIAHGLLHLIGYDDVTAELQAEMTRQENLALDLLQTLRDEACCSGSRNQG